MPYRLLESFKRTFDGQPYLHRRSTLGDGIAVQLYEDLLEISRSSTYVTRVTDGSHVVNRANRRRGIVARRGDGTFGELIPGAEPVIEPGFRVPRGPVATVELGIEVKILAKAMLKQIDRVITDLQKQVEHFRRGAGNPICVAVIGINHAAQYTSYEGDRIYPTDGRRYAHPSDEASDAEQRIRGEVGPHYDETVILRFRASNVAPYPFAWVNHANTQLDYGAALIRISREYDARFR